ncbi:DUF6268 family outer membrane beta-barrel protein [Flavobacterium sp. RHBU_3]|uniref:DUF6268 family outer membrane beta-barrel protein n=1 Tax=Flavobacterium sp. RHBU_3 TaxID=3391184 RepID=UPI0039856375
MFKFLAVLICITCLATAQAQETGSTLSYNYSSVYNKNASSLSKHKADYQYKKGNLGLIAGISAYGIDYGSNEDITTDGVKNITAIQAGITYSHPLSETWKVTGEFTPQLVSNMKDVGIKDLYPDFFAGFTYKPGNNSETTLTFGAGYKGYFGKYRFMPVINYAGKLANKVYFNLGIPATWVNYKFNDVHSLKAIVSSGGFYSRITGSEPVYIDNNTRAQAIEMISINAGLEYSFASGKEWEATVRGGYSLYNKLYIPYANTEHDLGFKENIYLSAGFKYNLKL